jgi:uncharacterized protein (DUF952 family)
MTLIYHITDATEFESTARSGEYRPRGFETNGIIHCSYAHQVKAVAESRFRGRSGLVLLQIDATRLPSAVIDENLDGGAELYPHISGSLPMAAVVSVREVSVPEHAPFELPCNVDV